MRMTVGAKPFRWLVALLALALLVAACGSDTAGEAETTDDDVAADDGDAEDPDSLVPTGDPLDDEEAGDDAGADDAATDAADDATDDATDDDAADDGEGDDVAAEPAGDNVIVFGDEQEPTIFNGFLIDGNSVVTSKIEANVLAGLYRTLPDLSSEPDLLAEDAEVTEDPFTVTYTLRDDITWSDGEPITTEDVAFTYETIMTEDEEVLAQITSQAGYDQIAEYEVVDDQVITFTYDEPFPAFRILFDRVMPQHVLDGEDFLTVWSDGIVDPATGEGIASGPFIFDEYTQGQQVRLVANEGYWGDPPGVDEIIMRYVGDTTTLTQQFRGGEINMFDPQPQIELVEQIEQVSGADYQVVSGATWEHIDFNQGVEGLDQAFVRQAIIQGIDRETIVDSLIRPIEPEAEVTNNIMYVNNQEQYEPNWERWAYDPDAAVALLEENGCVQGGDGIYECDGTRLSFRIGTTGGNERRELTQQLVQANLLEIGIEITIENAEGADWFLRMDTPENCDGVCDYDLGLFAWVGTPNPGSAKNIYGCERPQNWMVYCNEEVTQLLDQGDTVIDPEEQAVLFNEGDALMAEDVPMVPLFQQPSFVAYPSDLEGVEVNPSTATVFWNAGEWAFAQ